MVGRYAESRARRERALAQRAELEVRRLSGELIDLREARRVVATAATTERLRWECWPARISAEVAAELEVDEGRLVRVLEERVREHLREIASDPPAEMELRP